MINDNSAIDDIEGVPPVIYRTLIRYRSQIELKNVLYHDTEPHRYAVLTVWSFAVIFTFYSRFNSKK